MSDNDVLKLLESYDGAEVGSDDRRKFGEKIDDLGKKLKPSHVSRHIDAYMKMRASKLKERENDNE